MTKAPKPRLRRDLLAELTTDEHRGVHAGVNTPPCGTATCVTCWPSEPTFTCTCGVTNTCGCTYASITCNGC